DRRAIARRRPALRPRQRGRREQVAVPGAAAQRPLRLQGPYAGEARVSRAPGSGARQRRSRDRCRVRRQAESLREPLPSGVGRGRSRLADGRLAIDAAPGVSPMSARIERRRGVLVAGAGPVGAITALRLAKAGIPVTLLEAEPSIANSPRAIVYHPPTVAVLDRLGLLERASAMGVTKQDYQFRTPDGRIIARMDMKCTEGDTPYPFNLHLGQHRLAQLATDDLL